MADEIYYTAQQDKAVQFSYYYFGQEATFTIPYGYSFCVVGYVTYGGVEYASVQYGPFEGVVPKAQIEGLSVAATVAQLPEVSVTVDDASAYRIAGGKRAQFDLNKEDELYYLGTAALDDVDYYAVYCKGQKEIFFVVQSHTNKAEVEAAIHPHNTTDTTTVIAPTDSEVEPKKQGFTWMRFVLILGIVIPLITIIIMIIRPRRARPKQAREIYEDTDDYDGIDEV